MRVLRSIKVIGGKLSFAEKNPKYTDSNGGKPRLRVVFQLEYGVGII